MNTVTMPIAGVLTNGPPAVIPLDIADRLHRFSVAEYQRLIEEGFFSGNEDLELLEGLLVKKMARNPPHDGWLDIVEQVLRGHLPAGWRLRSQKAVVTDESQPEPDLAVVPEPASQYTKRHPHATEVAFVGEVAESSVEDDRVRKGRIYARAGIPCYWIVNLIDNQIEVYTDPTGPHEGPHYRNHEDFKAPTAVPLVIGGQEVARIPVAALLP